ncbi:SGNH/GDSL hydrolase family protein [Candidatus Gottesmanbacteria bacterium]|nr:SGNH/GDSL hydrolase family protein [Candidatus Gottesmanbacteria bacterium]
MKRLIPMIISTICTLFLLEATLRIFWVPANLDPRFRRHDIQWMEQNVVYNSYGYRDVEYTQGKPANIFRIYSLGDSYTFGWYLPDTKNTYTKLLEHDLNENQHIASQIINAASPGFSMKEEVDRFMEEGRYFNPDLVTIGLNYGDFITVGQFPNIMLPFQNELNKSYLYRTSVGRLIQIIESKRRREYLLNIFQNPDSPDWKEAEKLLVHLQKETAAINAKLVIVLFPHLDTGNPDGPYLYIPMHEKLTAFAKEHDITLVDPLPLYKKYKDKEKLVLNPIDAHPTNEAHVLVFQAFLRSFSFSSYIASHQPYQPRKFSVSVRSERDRLPAFKKIWHIKSSDPGIPWVYMNDDQSVKTIPLIDAAARQSPIYQDTLQIFKPSQPGQPGNTIGASMKYHILAKNQSQGQIIIPTILYGYPVVGIENIQGLYIEKQGGTVKEFITPMNINFTPQQITIFYKPAADYYVFQLELAVAVKQLTVTADGRIAYITKTSIITYPMKKSDTRISIPIGAPIVGLPQFTDMNDSYSYVIDNGVLTRLQEIHVTDNQLDLQFVHPIRANAEISIPVELGYTIDNNEVLTLDLEQ